VKSWHWGIIIAVIVGYALGLYFPTFGNSLKSKVGL
jgi:hypothetical protein